MPICSQVLPAPLSSTASPCHSEARACCVRFREEQTAHESDRAAGKSPLRDRTEGRRYLPYVQPVTSRYTENPPSEGRPRAATAGFGRHRRWEHHQTDLPTLLAPVPTTR